MTLFERKSFSVPASSSKAPKDCRHGWIDAHRKCVLCGASVPEQPQRGVRRESVTRIHLDGLAKR